MTTKHCLKLTKNVTTADFLLFIPPEETKTANSRYLQKIQRKKHYRTEFTTYVTIFSVSRSQIWVISKNLADFPTRVNESFIPYVL